jgi:erythromycin esterase
LRLPPAARSMGAMRRSRAVLALGVLFVTACGGDGPAAPSQSAPPAADPAVTSWLAQRAIPFDTVEPDGGHGDLQAVRAMVGAARVVSLGEATHGTAEFFKMKHRLLRLLVEEEGFTAFGIEASFPDTEAINEFVLTGRGDARRALAGQGFWTWTTEEVRGSAGPDWFLAAHPHRNIGAIFEPASDDYHQNLRLDQLYDVVVFVRDTTASALYSR